MGYAADDNVTNCRPPAAGAEPDDAVYDALDVRFLYLAISQWFGSLLGGF